MKTEYLIGFNFGVAVGLFMALLYGANSLVIVVSSIFLFLTLLNQGALTEEEKE